MRRLIVLVYCTSMHWGVFIVLSSAQTKQKASKPFMKVNFKNSNPPPLFKLAEVFPYLMIENSTSFFKPSPVIGRGEIDPQFAGSRTLPFTSHTISTWVLCTQKSSCVVFVCLWLVCAPGVPCTLKQWGCQWDDSVCVCAERGVALTHWTDMCDEAHKLPPTLWWVPTCHHRFCSPARFWKLCPRTMLACSDAVTFLSYSVYVKSWYKEVTMEKTLLFFALKPSNEE